MRIGAQTPDGATAASYVNVTETITLAKNDYIYFKTDAKGSQYGAMTITAKAQTSDVILLESQDEIFTDWTPWTPTWAGYGTVGGSFHYRRNGSNMEMLIDSIPATATGDNVSFTLPSGYTIDSTKFNSTVNTPVAAAGFNTYNTGNYMWVVGSKSTEQDFGKIFLGVQNGTNSDFNRQAGTGFGAAEITGFISVPIQGWNANFNPLLSLPLVEIGGAVEEYSVAGNATDSTNETYRPYFNSTGTEYIVNKNTINLYGTVDNNSTQGWNFKASQRCIVTWAGSFGNNSSTGQWGLIKTPHAPWSGTTAPDNPISNAQFDSFVLGGGVAIGDAGESQRQTFRFVMEPGEYIQVVKSFNGNESANYITGLYMTVEKDFSNTNMAHIIKPAVATLLDVRASTVAADSAGTGGFNNRVLNTIRGDSWFVELTGTGSTGIGGNNTDFTLQPGTYNVKAYAPTFNCNSNKIRLYDVTNDSNGNIGLYCYTDSNDDGSMIGFYQEVIHVTASTKYRLQQWTDNNGTLGFGGGAGAGSGDNVYTQVVIEKLK
jgi:hypothetical protein